MPFSLIIAHALNHARITLEAGFTTVRDAAGIARREDGHRPDLFPGPRLRIAVSALSQTGGHGDSVMPNGASVRPVSELPFTVVDGVEGVRRATREVLRADDDQIKVHTSGSVTVAQRRAGRDRFFARRDRGHRLRGPRGG